MFLPSNTVMARSQALTGAFQSPANAAPYFLAPNTPVNCAGIGSALIFSSLFAVARCGRSTSTRSSVAFKPWQTTDDDSPPLLPLPLLLQPTLPSQPSSVNTWRFDTARVQTLRSAPAESAPFCQ